MQMVTEGSAGGELQAHERTYEGFISLFKVGTVVSMILAAIVILLIAS
jgi:hypothetical protein